MLAFIKTVQKENLAISDSSHAMLDTE